MEVRLTDHAITRFGERVRPTLLRTAAERELRALTNQGELRAELDWRYGGECDAYLLLADGVALTLKHNKTHWVATSCLVRSGLSPERRAARQKRRRDRRFARRQAVWTGRTRNADWWQTHFGKEAA